MANKSIRINKYMETVNYRSRRDNTSSMILNKISSKTRFPQCNMIVRWNNFRDLVKIRMDKPNCNKSIHRGWIVKSTFYNREKSILIIRDLFLHLVLIQKKEKNKTHLEFPHKLS